MSSLDNPRGSTIYDAYLDFGMIGDHRVVFDGATTGGTNVITSPAEAAFTNEDVGRRITLARAGVGGAVYVGTVTSINSGTSVNVTPATTTTVSARGLQLGTDNTAAINAFVTFVNTTSAANPGIILEFGQSPTNGWGWPVRSTFNNPVLFRGLGGSFNVDTGNYTKTGGTRLAWWSDTEDGGVEFGAWLNFEPAGGDVQAMVQPAFEKIWFDGRNGDQAQALFGVRFAGCIQPIIDDAFFIDCKIPIICEATTVAVSPVNTQGVLRPSFTRVNFRNLETFDGAILTPITTSTAITLTNTGQNITVSAATMPTTERSRYAWVATHEGVPCLVLYTGGGTTTLNVKCSVGDAVYTYQTVNLGNVVSCAPNNSPMMLMSGNVVANTNCGLVQQVQGSYGANWGPAGIELRNSDSMSFKCIYLNGGSSAAATTPLVNRTNRPGVRICGSSHATQALPLAARNHTFLDIDPGSLGGGNIYSVGLLNTGAKLIAPAGPQYIELYQLGNGAPAPTIEANSLLDWTPNGGVWTGLKNIRQANQAFTATTLTQVTGSTILLPPQAFQIGTTFQWEVHLLKTAAGTAASLCNIRVGALGTTADPNVMQFSRTPTAALDDGVVRITYNITVIGGAATGVGTWTLAHAATTNTGFQNTGITIIGTPTAFNSLVSGLQFISLSFTTGTGEVVSSGFCSASILRIGNQG